MDMKRGIVQNVEERIERIVGHRDIFLPHIDEKNWKILKALIKIRQTTLDEIMIPTEEEIKRMSRLIFMMTTAWRVPLNISGTRTDRL